MRRVLKGSLGDRKAVQRTVRWLDRLGFSTMADDLHEEAELHRSDLLPQLKLVASALHRMDWSQEAPDVRKRLDAAQSKLLGAIDGIAGPCIQEEHGEHGQGQNERASSGSPPTARG